MLNKENKQKLLKVSSEDFIFFMEKRGNNYDETLKKNLYCLENDHKTSEIKRNELYTKYNIPESIRELIDIFHILDKQ